MKLNLATELKSLDGKPMKNLMLAEVITNVISKTPASESNEALAKSIVAVLDDEERLTKNATVGMVAFNALLAETEGTPEEKYKRGRLAERLYGGKTIDLDIDEVKLIKDMVGKHSNTTVIVRMWDALEKANK